MQYIKKNLNFLLVLLLIFNLLILSIQSYSYLWFKFFSFLISPIVKIIHSVTYFISNTSFKIKELKEAKEENKILKEKLFWQEIKLNRTIIENIYLRELSEVPFLPEFSQTIKKAFVLRLDVPEYSSKMVLSLGSINGIKENQVAITEEGLAGRIVKVEPFVSYLLPIVNTDSVVSGVVERSGVHGVMRGDGTGFLKLKYVPAYSDVRENDIVFTDCWDLTYPYGIKIGFVDNLSKETEELKIRVRPFVDFSNLSFVYIIKGVKN